MWSFNLTAQKGTQTHSSALVTEKHPGPLVQVPVDHTLVGACILFAHPGC